MRGQEDNAPGWPGTPPRWTSSAKTGVGTALTSESPVWFTTGHGILNEIYYPRIDTACTRDLGLIVTDGEDFFSEEKRHTSHRVEYVPEGPPLFRLINTCLKGRYRIEKEIVTDPGRDVLLQFTRFMPLRGTLKDYRLYVLLAPHLGNQGYGNTAWVGDCKGIPMLFAARERYALALSCSSIWAGRSVGFVGVSDGWKDLFEHKRMTWQYARAENGNVALAGEVDLLRTGGAFVLAVGFGTNAGEAGLRALASLKNDPDKVRSEYVSLWKAWHASASPRESAGPPEKDLGRVSVSVLRVHESKHFPGGMIASLSVPWGFSKGDDDLGGYHLVWPRDLVEGAGGLLAAGATHDVRRVVAYLELTQEADGHWPQNMWLDGTPYWGGVQMDETAFPVLLVDLARRKGVLQEGELPRLWPMVRRSVSFLVRNGPVTPQDRWEEDPGYSPFTLAVEVSALLAGADLADRAGEPGTAAFLRETADAWNGNIERWTYVTDTDLARQVGVEGYYVRIAPPEMSEAASPLTGFVAIKNRPPGQSMLPAAHIVSPDALALVRFGLRAANDPRIVTTVKVIDALLKVDTPSGPAWHRYNGDGYGEHRDGSPFDGTGVGRLWPLLTGERGHYELAAGNPEEALRMLKAMESFANEAGMIPEQVWDSDDIPERGLFFGRPSGSAMPLAWAHAEYIKLARSLREGRVFDMPPQPLQRYQVEKRSSPFVPWRFNNRSRRLSKGKVLRVELLASAVVHWTADDWRTVHDTETTDTGLGVHIADLSSRELSPGEFLRFTFYWPEAGRWEGADFAVSFGA